MAERSKALRSGRSLSGGVGSNPTSDKSFPLVCGETLARLSPPRCRKSDYETDALPTALTRLCLQPEGHPTFKYLTKSQGGGFFELDSLDQRLIKVAEIA